MTQFSTVVVEPGTNFLEDTVGISGGRCCFIACGVVLVWATWRNHFCAKGVQLLVHFNVCLQYLPPQKILESLHYELNGTRGGAGGEWKDVDYSRCQMVQTGELQ